MGLPVGVLLATWVQRCPTQGQGANKEPKKTKMYPKMCQNRSKIHQKILVWKSCGEGTTGSFSWETGPQCTETLSGFRGEAARCERSACLFRPAAHSADISKLTKTSVRIFRRLDAQRRVVSVGTARDCSEILRAFPSTIDPKFTVRLHHRMQICPPPAAPKAPGPDAAVTSHRLLNILFGIRPDIEL